MIASVIDLYDRAAPALPPLGDTAYEYATASARQTAGLVGSWATRLPVVLDGDGTMTQSDIANAAASAAAAVLPDSTKGGVFTDAINHTLLGALGIIIIAVGLFFLVKE